MRPAGLPRRCDMVLGIGFVVVVVIVLLVVILL